jgi:ABC-type transport system substrate-binding protein
LISLNAEHLDQYLPNLATSWTSQNITGTTSPEGLAWYYRYTFQIRTGVKYWDGSIVTPEDIEYCYERMMATDYSGGPQWMFFEPLLNGAAANYINNTEYDLTLQSDAILCGKMIDHSVESNATHVWFNVAFPGAYGPWIQILSQPWASVYSKAWANSLGRATNWDGVWGDYTEWVTHWNPAVPPFDDPTPVAMGSGPFKFETWDNTLKQVSLNRYVEYWQGWPADYPKQGASSPKGYVDHFVVTWAYDWAARQTMIKKGEHGSMFFSDKFIFLLPAYPIEKVVDPTGAGDTFAGGFMGYLSRVRKINEKAIHKAIAYGTIAASFNVEGFGLERTARLSLKEIEKRLIFFKKHILL